MMMMIPLTILCFLCFLSSSLIGAIPLEQRDIWNPPIISPDATTVWAVGDKVEVTWNTTDKPPDSQLTSPFGRVVLGFLTADSLNLMFETPLAQGFPLSAGKVEVTVPNVPVRNNYIVVVFGDSGNNSPTFTITGGGAVSGSASLPADTSSRASSATRPIESPSITAPIPITGSAITGGSTATPTPLPPNSSAAIPPVPSTPVSSSSIFEAAPVPSSTEPSAPTSSSLLPSSSINPTGTALPASGDGNTNGVPALRVSATLYLAMVAPMAVWALL